MARVAIYIALYEELTYAVDELRRFGRFLGRPPETSLPQGQSKFHFELSRFPDPKDRIELSLIKGMGNVLSAAYVGSSFSSRPDISSHPELVLLVGISGSLASDKAGLRDVIVSNSVKYYSPDKIYHLDGRPTHPIDKDQRLAFVAEGHKHTRPVGQLDPGVLAFDDRDLVYGNNLLRFLRDHVFHEDLGETGHLFVEEFNKKNPKSSFKLMSSALLGSNWVIDSETYAAYVSQKNEWVEFDYYYLNAPEEFQQRCKWPVDDPVAVDMESYGFFKAISALAKFGTSVKAYSIRGVSDLCAGKSTLDRESKSLVRKEAAGNAVNIAVRLAEYYLNGGEYLHELP